MNERSSAGSFFPNTPSSKDRATGDDAFVTKALAVGATLNVAIPTIRVSATVKREKDIIVVDANRFLCARIVNRTLMTRKIAAARFQ